MRLLLDTHIALWSLAGSHRLSARGRVLIEEPANEIFVSVVSLWEIAIKRAKGRRDVPKISSAHAAQSLPAAGFQLLGVTVAHAVAVEHLPNIHSDPFDRLLVAQARSEPLIMMTHDGVLGEYGDGILLV